MFISLLYMFQATVCPSSAETTVSMRHLVFVALWMTVWYAPCIPDSHPQSDKYQVSHRYSCFCCWWAQSRLKHVEKRNKHTKKNCAPSWLYLQDQNRHLKWTVLWPEHKHLKGCMLKVKCLMHFTNALVLSSCTDDCSACIWYVLCKKLLYAYYQQWM